MCPNLVPTGNPDLRSIPHGELVYCGVPTVFAPVQVRPCFDPLRSASALTVHGLAVEKDLLGDLPDARGGTEDWRSWEREDVERGEAVQRGAALAERRDRDVDEAQRCSL